jgi:hypothetical protein
MPFGILVERERERERERSLLHLEIRTEKKPLEMLFAIS